MPATFRFIHTGDLHLGSPLKTVGKISGDLQRSLMESSYTALRNIVDAALAFSVDFVLMCGDIYDNEARSVQGNLFLAAQMERLAAQDIPVFMIYGNHDPLGKGADFFKLPSNVRVLGAEAVEICEVVSKTGRGRARVLGQSYSTPSESRKMHLSYKPPVDNLFTVAMLHTGLDPGSTSYVPSSQEELKKQPGIHYWALGHIHAPRIVDDSNPVIAYPGIPQGRDVGEAGLKGCFLVEVVPPAPARVQFIPTSPVIWLSHVLSLDFHQSLDNIGDLEDLLVKEGRKIISAGPQTPPGCPDVEHDFKPEGYVVRWELHGRSPLHDDLISGHELEIEETLAEALNQRLPLAKPYLWTEGVKLRTGSPLPDLERLLQRDETLKTLLEIKQGMQQETDLKKEAIAALGQIWYKPREQGDLRDDAFPITPEKFDSLLEDAFNLVLERIVKEREDF